MEKLMPNALLLLEIPACQRSQARRLIRRMNKIWLGTGVWTVKMECMPFGGLPVAVVAAVVDELLL